MRAMKKPTTAQKISVQKVDRARTSSFRRAFHAFITAHPMRSFPWRKTTNPYKIAVSEIMLQQTQADRVVEKYKLFLRAFPTVQSLADAPVRSVVQLWSGLGYNRRALYLKKMAEEIVGVHRGVFPKTVAELEMLPGIGPYTARAIVAFAYNEPNDIIETNIRTVFIHHFFSDVDRKITDDELRPFIQLTMDKKNPRAWYNLLMDYGSFLKKNGNSAHRKSRTYIRQAPFEGSRRAVRGAILRALHKNSLEASHLLTEVSSSLPPHPSTSCAAALAREALATLQKDGLIISKKKGKKTMFSITQS